MKKVCVVGMGPAGIGAAYALAQSRLATYTVCIDAGVEAEKKRCQILEKGSCRFEEPCHMISGIGGASSSASGKISGYPAGSGIGAILRSKKMAKDKLEEALTLLEGFLPLNKPTTQFETVLAEKEFKKLGFIYRYYPVYTFRQEHLAESYTKMLADAKSKGVLIRLNSRVTDITLHNGLYRLTLTQNHRKVVIDTEYLILAVGYMGQDLVKLVHDKFSLGSGKYHMDVGVRLEFPAELYPEIDRCHKDLKLLFDNARTFCVCKNGKIASYRYKELFFLDGFLDPRYKTGFTNLAIIVRLSPSHRNKELFENIRNRILSLSKGKPIRQTLTDYLKVPKTCDHPGQDYPCDMHFWQWGNINECFPQSISSRIRKAVDYFATKILPKDQWDKVSVFAPQIDCRLMFPLKDDFSLKKRLYMAGDCTGRFRGILQAFCSGIICAQNIIGDCRENT